VREGWRKKVTRRKYWVHPYFNKSCETGSVVVTEPDQDRGRFWQFYTRRYSGLKICPFLKTRIFTVTGKCFSTRSTSLISASSLLIGSTSKAFWQPFRFQPSVAICLRLSDRRHSMLRCHRIVSTRRKHTVILSPSPRSNLKHRVESNRKKIV
jgi:hypothetical protein